MAKPPKPENEKLTPMMAQYTEIRQANPDGLLFYRMGDFYELFFEDAETASRVLGIALTSRGTHQGKPIPMAGVPVHAATDYLNRLIEAGHKVSICEQVEDPAEAKKRGAKSVVRREVRRIATPGTLTEDSLLKAKASNYLLALSFDSASDARKPLYAVAWTDISTGEFQFTSLAKADLAGELSRLQPREVLLPVTQKDDDFVVPLLQSMNVPITDLGLDAFSSEEAKQRLARFYDVPDPDILAGHRRAELGVAGAILSYIEITQLGATPPLSPPARQESSAFLVLDASTLANLELLRTMGGERQGSLLDVLDQTVTGPGSREMAKRVGSPLVAEGAINERLDAVAFLVADRNLRLDIRQNLTRLPDMLRALTRLSMERGEPRDLAAIQAGVQVAGALQAMLDAGSGLPKLLDLDAGRLILPTNDLLMALEAALQESLPASKRDGGFIRPKFDAVLDEAKLLRDESRQLIAAMQARYADEAGIKSLKIKHNHVLGYFIETQSLAGEQLLQKGRDGESEFIHRQSMANAHRFTTRELDELQVKILAAADRALERELAIFEDLRALVISETRPLQVMAEALADLDCHAALAHLADEENWVRPMVDESLEFLIEGGRHPVVERAVMRDGHKPFVANDCDLSAREPGLEAGQIMLITGPNMAGKSTYLRQNALMVIIAQMGAFVPAVRAHIGAVDRLFSRVGASDDLARGRSTFMVEMVETAAILNQSTPRSLVILDEIGRGTATFDGLSIAWASMEHLHEVNYCRCLFATHFHELTALTKKLSRLTNATIKVKEWKSEVIFMHEVVPGTAEGSYGIQVARLAGLPSLVITRARDVLTQLEKEERTSHIDRMVDDLPLFAIPNAREGGPDTDDATGAFLDKLQSLAVDDLSPRQALEQLFTLSAEARALKGR